MTKLTSISCAAMACVAIGLAAGSATNPAQAGTLENLERERAMFIDALLDPEATPAERIEKMRISKRRRCQATRSRASCGWSIAAGSTGSIRSWWRPR